MLIAMMLAAAIAKDAAPLDPGPAPSFAQAVAMSEAAMRERLVDPASAQFEWPYAFTSGTLKALLGRKRGGWYTCGWVNSRNRMGGYSGRSWFLVMINSGVVTSLDIGETGQIDAASATCPGLLKKGVLTPSGYIAGGAAPPSVAPSIDPAALSTAAALSAATAAKQGGLGISWQPTPVGALLLAVAPGSAAERAGLKPGQVIEAVNGVSIKGFPPAALNQAVHPSTPVVTYAIVGIGEVKVTKPTG